MTDPLRFSAIGTDLQQAILKISRERRMAITNGKDFAAVIRARIAASKANAEAVKADVVASLDHFDNTIATASTRPIQSNGLDNVQGDKR